jgi:HKD family nuclease
MNISSTDIEITRNYRVYKENLYRAEGIAMRAVKLKLTNEIDYSAVVDSNNLSDDAFVQSSEKPSVLNNLNHTVIKNNWNSTSGYMVFENAWEPGDFVVFSRSRKNGGYAFVEIGIEQD